MLLADELADLRRSSSTIPGLRVINSNPELAQIELKFSPTKCLRASFRFGPSYPTEPLVVQLKSKTLSEPLLQTLSAEADKEAKARAAAPQLLHVARFLSTILEQNRLAVCYDEILRLRRRLDAETDTVKLKEKHGTLQLQLNSRSYFLKARLSIPYQYPLKPTETSVDDSNLPKKLVVFLRAQVAELARQCVEAPAARRKKSSDSAFEPRASLTPVFDFLFDAFKSYPLQRCGVCSLQALPDESAAVTERQSDARFVERSYCDHLYHYECLDRYMKQPPFHGKECLTCGKTLYHDRWNVTPDVRQQRWAHKEAKQRELEEVVDFLE